MNPEKYSKFETKEAEEINRLSQEEKEKIIQNVESREKEKNYISKKLNNDPLNITKSDSRFLQNEKEKESLKEIHDVYPEAIFLTQTSATPYGWLIQEAYRNSWPDEDQPPLFTIDVKYEVYVYQSIASKMESRPQKEEFFQSYVKQLRTQQRFKEKIENLKKYLQRVNPGSVVIFDEAYHPDYGGGPSLYHHDLRGTVDFARELMGFALEDIKSHSAGWDEAEITISGFGDPYRAEGHEKPFKRTKDISDELANEYVKDIKALSPESYTKIVEESKKLGKKEIDIVKNWYSNKDFLRKAERNINSQPKRDRLKETIEYFKNKGAKLGREIYEEKLYGLIKSGPK